jgi:hypothetical protein
MQSWFSNSLSRKLELPLTEVLRAAGTFSDWAGLLEVAQVTANELIMNPPASPEEFESC